MPNCAGRGQKFNLSPWPSPGCRQIPMEARDGPAPMFSVSTGHLSHGVCFIHRANQPHSWLSSPTVPPPHEDRGPQRRARRVSPTPIDADRAGTSPQKKSYPSLGPDRMQCTLESGSTPRCFHEDNEITPAFSRSLHICIAKIANGRNLVEIGSPGT